MTNQAQDWLRWSPRGKGEKSERRQVDVPRQNFDPVKGVLLIGCGEVGCYLEVDAGDFVLVQNIETEGGWVGTACVR